MDPITQGAFGAVFAQLHGRKKDIAKAGVIGALAGMAPDLDILIRSMNDPLLALEYHRHFTHSLLFIPFGGLIVSLVLHPLLGRRWGLSFLQTLLWCIIGYATHALLDACTSYGTQLLWPLTNTRFSWDIISVIDPLVTVPILVLTILAARRKARGYVFLAIAWLVLYFGFAAYLHERALAEGVKLAESRGLEVVRLEAKPSFANIVVWKIITETKDTFYVDAIKPFGDTPNVWEGQSSKKLDIDRDLPWLDKSSQQAKDIERFRWFSMDYIALDKNNPNRVADIRYSLLPQEIQPLWGIDLSPDATPEDHIVYYNDRGDSRGAVKRLWQMIWE
ncbi:metal-dependent hydrolase [Leucothrix arctica]|uniref:Metal-dependent hydrolase n=1 Tax=Leucothrix arctica TaxID=1481894 RepID=A0A317CAD9_9GAMM|nr:metal-dependent hydrolase [Leucothrix arctica]PWQ95349.1 metal-dependent hydrolase [Leucothrix arctica]